MTKATWNGTTLAASDRCMVIEGNHYFPPDSIHFDYLRKSRFHTVCPWKGTADYYDVVVNGEINKDAAWCYHVPKEAAMNIKDYIAFWKGVVIEP